MLQAFEQAIPVIELAKTEGQVALDLIAEFHGTPGLAEHRASVVIVDEQPGQVPQAVEVLAPRARLFNAADIRARDGRTLPGTQRLRDRRANPRAGADDRRECGDGGAIAPASGALCAFV
jgi:hypothetical protein